LSDAIIARTGTRRLAK